MQMRHFGPFSNAVLCRKHHNIYFSRPFFRVFPVGFFATSTPLEDRGRALAQGINVWDKKPNPTTRKLLETFIMVFEFLEVSLAEQLGNASNASEKVIFRFTCK